MTIKTEYSFLKRPRRNRKSPAVRSLLRENTLQASDLIVPFFVLDGEKCRQPIPSMPRIDRLSLDLILKEAELLHAQGIPGIALFSVIDSDLKNDQGSKAWNAYSLIPQAVQTIKKEIPKPLYY